MTKRDSIFISYRREDSEGYAGRLYDRLSTHFKSEQVFMDVDNIEPGLDFVEVIEKAVGSCDVLLAVIGRQWLTVADARGRRRLDNTEDFVRLEIATALERGVRIIPVLVGGAAMPTSEDLPPALAKLARRNAIELTAQRWKRDVGQLIKVIKSALAAPVPQLSPRPAPEARQLPPRDAERAINGLDWRVVKPQSMRVAEPPREPREPPDALDVIVTPSASNFARNLVFMLKLKYEQAVRAGLAHGDIYDRLSDAIDGARERYDRRFPPEMMGRRDRFHEALVSILAEGDVTKLGPNYFVALARRV